MRDFRKYDVWKDGIQLVKKVYALTNLIPDTEKFGLISQMNRCAVSIPSNIAEGCGRDTQKDFKRFLEISLGSAYELETQLFICNELDFISFEELETMVDSVHSLQKQITALVNKISSTL